MEAYTVAVLMTVAFLVGAATKAQAADAKNERLTICQLCGMDAAKSETEFILYRKTAPQMHACCINCARRTLSRIEADVERITALDYRTRKHVPAQEAFYVIGSERMPRGSMIPFVFAFGAREEAEAFRRRNGGDVLGFDEVIARLEADRKPTPRRGKEATETGR